MASQISKYGLNRLSSIHRDFPLDSPFRSKFSLPKTSHSPISLTWIIFSHLTIYAINGCSRIQRQQLLKLKYDIIDVFKNFSFLHPEKELWFYCMGLNLSPANMPSKKDWMILWTHAFHLKIVQLHCIYSMNHSDIKWTRFILSYKTHPTALSLPRHWTHPNSFKI